MYELSIIEVRPISIINVTKKIIIMSALSSYVYDHHIDALQERTLIPFAIPVILSLHLQVLDIRI